MTVTYTDEFKFPITSAPIPIPDPELYQEKTLADGRQVWISAPLPDRLRIVIPISKWVYSKHISPEVSVAAFFEKFVEHVTSPPLMVAEVFGESKYSFQAKEWRSTTLVFGKRDSRVYFSRVKEKGLGLSIRLDMNPRKLGLLGCKHLRQFLETLFDLPGLLLSARVRRLDVAVDVVGLSVVETVAHHKQQAKRSLYVGADGQVETVYIHKKASPTKMPKDPDSPEKPTLPNKPAGEVLARIYDRVKFSAVLGKDAPFCNAPVTRIELVKSRFYDKNENARLGKLPTMTNPLVELRAGYVGSQVKSMQAKWWAYVAACKACAPEQAAAILHLSPEVAAQFEQALAVPNPDLLEPVSTWKRWEVGLVQTGLMQLLLWELPDAA